MTLVPPMHYTYITADRVTAISMTLLKHINKPSLLLPFEQIYIHIFQRNNELIPEKHPYEHNPMFELHIPPPASYQSDSNQYSRLPVSPLSISARYGSLQR